MKSKLAWIAAAIGLLIGVLWFMFRGTSSGKEVEYRYAPVAKGELLLSTSSVGTLVPLTRVDVKSKAGGRVDELLVEEGRVVKQGDMIAFIDPTDTRSLYLQADADLRSARSRVSLAETNAVLEAKASENRVHQAKIALQLAQVRLEKAITESKAQPDLTEAELARTYADVNAQTETLKQFDAVESPQRRREAEANSAQAQSSLTTAENEVIRQRALLDKGYVSRASVERAESAYSSAKSAFEIAKQRLATVDADLSSERRALAARLEQSRSSARTAEANKISVIQSTRSVTEARRAVDDAKLNLKEAQDNALQVRARQIDVKTAQSSVVRSEVSTANALDNLKQTKVTAPRPGVVTKKYLEEGTIIPGAVSAFAEGTSIVEISDVTTMFVECKVDEADISTIKVNQKARILVEAYPGLFINGVVERIFPAAETENNVTAVKVRVKISPEGLKIKDKPIRPGMNATVDFIQIQKPDVLIIPNQAIVREEGKTFVRVKGKDELSPEKREVKLGDTGNEGVEVLEGLKEGEEIVVAEIDLAAMRERQDRMNQAQQTGLGSRGPSGPSQSRGGMGGGARPGGGGGR